MNSRKRAAYKENLTREGVEVDGGLTARRATRMSELCSLLLMPLSLWCEEKEGGGGAPALMGLTGQGEGHMRHLIRTPGPHVQYSNNKNIIPTYFWKMHF